MSLFHIPKTILLGIQSLLLDKNQVPEFELKTSVAIYHPDFIYNFGMLSDNSAVNCDRSFSGATIFAYEKDKYVILGGV